MENEIHPASHSIEDLMEFCNVKRTRASGPGGQHRNKVETAIVVTFGPVAPFDIEVVGQASEKRSQEANRQVALQRLRVNLALAIRVPRASVSELWQARVQARRIRVNDQHQDYPALLAEALDFVHAADFHIPAAAERLLVSTSQLIKFLKTTPAALESINRKRETLGLSRLR